MKKVVVMILLAFVANAAVAQEESVKTGPQIEFKEKIFNFGTVVQGDTVEHVFVFENVGTEPLRITSARGSCGCTVPSYSKDAIEPGKKGEVFVRFRSTGRRGMQNKTVTLTTNSVDKRPVVLSLRGTVELPKSDGR